MAAAWSQNMGPWEEREAGPRVTPAERRLQPSHHDLRIPLLAGGSLDCQAFHCSAALHTPVTVSVTLSTTRPPALSWGTMPLWPQAEA